MSIGTVHLRVRPIRVGFLVNPNNPHDLKRAFSLSTYIWGGKYNPIIPSLNKVTKKWSLKDSVNSNKSNEIINRYIAAFDPDVLVSVGTINYKPPFDDNRRIISEYDFFSKAYGRSNTNLGISLKIIYDNFVNNELKYIRKDNLKLYLPTISRYHNLFLEALFGNIPTEVAESLHGDLYPNYFNFVDININNYADYLYNSNIFPIDLTSYKLKNPIISDKLIFIFDSKNIQDIIDFWNLRATGSTILPIPYSKLSDSNFSIIIEK
ncbi:MAG: hypothetical protein V2A56_01470, partial [bacterium]